MRVKRKIIIMKMEIKSAKKDDVIEIPKDDDEIDLI